MRKALLLVAAAASLLAGCSKGNKPAGGAAGSGPVALDGKPVTVAGVTFTPPSAWKDFGPGGMRAASYAYGPVKGDADSATVAVFYFGQGGGGAVAANMERWVGQMTRPDGESAAPDARSADGTAGGLPMHHVEVAGTYNGAAMGGGMMMGGGGQGRPGYYMSAVVLEAPEGNLFFKLTGPEKTAREMNAQFLAMVQAVKKAG